MYSQVPSSFNSIFAKARQIHEFCHGFLALNNLQRQAFLMHMSSTQAETLRNACFNLLMNKTIVKTGTDLSYLQRNIELVRTLSSRRVSLQNKKVALLSKAMVVARILTVVYNHIDSKMDKGEYETDSEEEMDAEESSDQKTTSRQSHDGPCEGTSGFANSNPRFTSQTDHMSEGEEEQAIESSSASRGRVQRYIPLDNTQDYMLDTSSSLSETSTSEDDEEILMRTQDRVEQ